MNHRHHASLPLFLACMAVLLVYGSVIVYFIQAARRRRK